MFCSQCKRSIANGFEKCWLCNASEAIITRFNPEKGYGFAERPGGVSVYFHMNYQRFIVCDGSEHLTYVKPRKAEDFIVPKIEQAILYEEEAMPDGKFRAKWWAFWEDYRHSKEQLEHRPLIRFVERNGLRKMSRLQRAPDLRLIWEGNDVGELRRLFPKKEYPSFSTGTRGMEFIEKRTDGWYEINDPR